jgi:flavin-binding protein dodecin
MTERESTSDATPAAGWTGRANVEKPGETKPRTRSVAGMWVSKVSEIIGSSPSSFEDAARNVVARAHRTLRGISGIEVVEKRMKVEGDGIAEYRVRLRLTFDVAPRLDSHW